MKDTVTLRAVAEAFEAAAKIGVDLEKYFTVSITENGVTAPQGPQAQPRRPLTTEHQRDQVRAYVLELTRGTPFSIDWLKKRTHIENGNSLKLIVRGLIQQGYVIIDYSAAKKPGNCYTYRRTPKAITGEAH